MPYKLSPSTLSLFRECPRCFWLHFNKNIKRPETIFPSLPSGMDRILKINFDKHRENGSIPSELINLKDIKLFSNISLLRVWRNNTHGILWKDENDNILHGAVDDILQKGSKLIVLDFKTRGYPLKQDTHEHYQDQLNLYNFLFRKNGYETEDYAYLLFYHPDKINDDSTIIFNKDLVKMQISVTDAEKLLKDALTTLQCSSMPENDKECEFCRWYKEVLSKSES